MSLPEKFLIDLVDSIDSAFGMPAVALSADHQGLVLSSGAEIAIGCKARLIPWSNFLEAAHPDDRAGIDLAKRMHLEDGVPFDIRFRVQQNGQWQNIDATLATLSDGSGSGMLTIGSLRDLNTHGTRPRDNELSQLIAEHQTAVMQSARLSSLGVMAGGIAHEINNPLAIISGTADRMLMLLKKGPLDPQLLTDSLKSISSTAVRISVIVRALRTLARDGATDPLVPTKLKTIIEDSMVFCTERVRNHSVELRMSPVPDDILVNGRAVQLSQVIINLVNNADDAIAALSQKWISIDIVRSKSTIDLRITDSGSGIPKELREKIMTPFFTTKDIGKGTGLGLSIAKSIMESHNGALILDETCPNTCFVMRMQTAE